MPQIPYCPSLSTSTLVFEGSQANKLGLWLFFFSPLPRATLISQGKVLATHIHCISVRQLLQWEARRSIRGFLRIFWGIHPVSNHYRKICCFDDPDTTLIMQCNVLYHSLWTFIYCTYDQLNATSGMDWDLSNQMDLLVSLHHQLSPFWCKA